MSLSPRARRLLRDVARQLPCHSRLKKNRTAVTGEIADWCHEHDIDLGARLSHRSLWFDAELLSQIDETLAALGEAALETELGGLTTTEQARHGSGEKKSVREKPREHRVLVNLPARPAPEWLSAEPREVLDLDWRHIVLSAFDALIQVENLDSFYAFMPDAEALAPFESPLVVYRGDAHYGGGFARLADAWADRDVPHCYAGDFDAAGMTFALSSGATHALLPPLAWLTQRATSDHLPAKQITHQPALRRHAATLPEGHSFRGYLAILLEQQRGLRQQWFDGNLVMVALDFVE